ncbi:MAG: DNA polymerase Y family protein [Thiohalomonadaceae bacterium]
MLWLSLHFPHLALEVFARAVEDPALPLLVSDAHGARQWVHARNRAAAAAGVRPGMALGAAQALLQTHRTLPRDEAAERAALERLAAWAGQFTSTVSLVPPQDLLLEIGGSLLLFGGLKALCTRVLEGAGDLGYRAAVGLAPVPLAAVLLARAGRGTPVLEKSALPAALGDLPVERLGLAEAQVAALRGMGLRRLADCLRLPRSGLARRLGPDTLAHLLRLLGELPDPRPAYVPPPRFESRLVLPAEVENTEALLFAARRQLLELGGFLRARGAGVSQLDLSLGHRGRLPSRLTIGLLSPSRDAGHLLTLLRTRLEQFTLPAPVDELVLCADGLSPLADEDRPLFGEEPRVQAQGEQLLEKLRARLGAEAVHGCEVVAEHRPERAWRRCDPGCAAETDAVFGRRPLWLLDTPEPLEELDGQPCRGGKLHLLSGPERIEAGWWNASVTRDYFVAEDTRHAHFWIFREHRERRWFLHGVFS